MTGKSGDSATDWNMVQMFWIEESDEAIKVANDLFEKGDYSYALFFGHLAMEKLLKAVYIKKQKSHAPPIHNLERLAELGGVDVQYRDNDLLIRVTAYNIEARYPDIRREFRKKCTSEFTQKELDSIKDAIVWLKSILK
jgi:HEPN domain-containing protein